MLVLEELFFTDGCGYEICLYICVLFHSLKVEPSPRIINPSVGVFNFILDWEGNPDKF
jgi:hypothetical protein